MFSAQNIQVGRFNSETGMYTVEYGGGGRMVECDYDTVRHLIAAHPANNGGAGSRSRDSRRAARRSASPPLEQPGMMSSVEDVALNALFETILTSTAQSTIRNIVEGCVHCHCRIGTQFAIMFLACFDHSDLHEQGTSRLSLRSFFARSWSATIPSTWKTITQSPLQRGLSDEL
jgi:hypothetical protein